MLTTPCSLCTFFSPEQRGCLAGQFCLVHKEHAVAPGLCRLHRSPKWRQKKLEAGVAPSELIEEAIKGSEFKYDLIVLFDEKRHTEALLRTTLDEMCEYERLIVADTTGQGGKNIASSIVAKDYALKPYLVDRLIEATQDDDAVDRMAKLVKAPYFVVLPAGLRIRGLFSLRHFLSTVQSRAVRWVFPYQVGETQMYTPKSPVAAYLTHGFRRLGGNHGKPFSLKLADIESETPYSLNWMYDRGLVY